MKPAHLALVLLISAVWGFNFVAAKVGVAAFPPVWFTGLRFLIVAALLAPALRWQAGQMRTVLAVSLFAGALHFALMFTGLKLADDVSIVAIVVQLNVPFAALLAVAMLGERLGPVRIAGIAAAFAGIVVVGFDPRVFGYIGAVGLIVLAGFFMAVAQILMRRLQRVGVFALQAWIGATAAPALLLLSLPLEAGQWAAMREAGAVGWAALAYTAVGASIVGHGGMYYLLLRYPVSLVAPMMLLAPLFGILCGVLFLDDVLTPRMALGGIVTLAGVLVLTLPERRAA